MAAVNAWVAARGGTDCVDTADCQVLVKCLRLDQLPTPYRVMIVPQQTWVLKVRRMAGGVWGVSLSTLLKSCLVSVFHFSTLTLIPPNTSTPHQPPQNQSETAMQLTQAAALLSLPPELAAHRDLQLECYSSLRRFRASWIGRGPRAPSAAPRLVIPSPAVDEERLRDMFYAAQRRLAAGKAPAAAAPAPAAEAREGAGQGAGGGEQPGGRRPTVRELLTQPSPPQQQQQPDGGAKRPAPGAEDGQQGSKRQKQQADEQQENRPPAQGGSGSGGKDGHAAAPESAASEAVAVSTIYWRGFHWHAALCWAPGAAQRGPGRPRRARAGTPPPPLQLQLSVSATNAWCRRAVVLELNGVALNLDSFASPANSQQAGQQPTAAEQRRRAARGGGVRGPQRMMAAGAGLQSPSQIALQFAFESGAGAAAPSAAKASGRAGSGAAAAGAAVGAGAWAPPTAGKGVLFAGAIPVDVTEWAYDWEGVEGTPLALKAYMRGGALRLSVLVAAVE